MKNNYCFLLLLSFALTAHGQNTVGTKQSLIPQGWTVFNEASGDLNKDSLVDLAIIIESSTPDNDGEKPRSLLVLLKNNKVDNTYMQICRADNVILGSQSGGVLGDPFSNMEIKKEVLRVDFYGGSREKWGTTHRYWFKGGVFYVIGATYTIESDAITETYDYNLYTGGIIVTKKDATNKANNKITNRVHKIVLPELAGFQPDAVWAILMPNDYAKVVTCVFNEVTSGDCMHVLFDCGDFGNAAVYLDEASEKMWYDLDKEGDPGDVTTNPQYKGKTFEITYAEATGLRCEPQGVDRYQLIVGFKLKN